MRLTGYQLWCKSNSPPNLISFKDADALNLVMQLRDATWDYPIELRFPREVFKSLMADKLPIVTPAEKATLCDRCRNLDFWSGGFSIRVKKHELQDNSVSPDPCDFCAMMLGVCNNLGIPDKALFSRYNSTLKVAGSVFGSTKGIILRSAVSTPNEPCLSLVTSDSTFSTPGYTYLVEKQG